MVPCPAPPYNIWHRNGLRAARLGIEARAPGIETATAGIEIGIETAVDRIEV